MQAAAQTVPERAGETRLRRIGPDDEANAALVRLYAGAYTVLDLGDREKRQRYETRLRESADEPGTVRIAAYRDDGLVGAMRWYDYTMRLRDRDVFAGGLGAVAVDLAARRRGIAQDMVGAFVDAYRERGAAVALLHPFRHDFYRRHSFGHGTKMNRYRVAPRTLPRGGESRRVREVDASEAEALAACYERVRVSTNGLIVTTADDFRKQLEDVTLRAYAYAGGDDVVRGFVLVRPYADVPNNPNTNELRAFEPIFEGPEAFLALMSFLRGLQDQFRAIVFETQRDDFHLVPSDPRNHSARIVQPPAYHETNEQGAGVMYRLLDPDEGLSVLGARAGGALRLSLALRDPRRPERTAEYEACFDDGGPPAAVRMTLDLAEFSSLVVGAVRLRSLHDFGLAALSDSALVPRLDRLFAPALPPLCTTRF